MPPIFSKTMGGLVLDLAILMGDRVAHGTADGTSSASQLDDDDLVDADDSRIKGGWVLIHTGTRAGDIRRVSAFTAGSDRITPTPNFSGALDTTSEYLVTRRWSPHEYLRAIQDAQRLIGGNLNFVESIDRSHVVGSGLLNGTFYRWTSGASSAPDGWTLGGTGAAVARESTQVRGGLFGAKLTSGSAVLTFSQALTRIGRLRGQSISFKAWVWNNTASEVTARLTDGVTTKDKANSGSSNWEYLETDPFQVTANASEITASIRVAASSKIAYVGPVWLPVGRHFNHEYDLDSDAKFVMLDGKLGVSQPISSSNGPIDYFTRSIGPEAWEVLHESTRKVALHHGENIDGSILSIKGWAQHAELTAVTTSWTANPDALLARAAERLWRMKLATVGTADEVALVRGNIAEWKAEADKLEVRFAQRLHAPKRVEWN